MMILKQAEFGKKNKGGGKVKANLASNKSRQRFAQEAAAKEEERLQQLAKEKTLKGRAIKAAGAAIDAIKTNKKTAGVAGGLAVAGAIGAVAAKKAHDKKRKMFATTSDGERLKLFSKKEEKGTAQTIAEDASSAAALGAAGGLGYTAVQGGKALLAAKEAAKYGYDNKEDYKKKRAGYALKGLFAPGVSTYVKKKAEQMAEEGKSTEEIREYLENRGKHHSTGRVLAGTAEALTGSFGGVGTTVAQGVGLYDKVTGNRKKFKKD